MDDALAITAEQAATTRSGWRIAAYAYALLVGAVLAYFLFGLTVQVSDSFGNLLEVQHATVWELMRNQGIAAGYLRPLLWAQFRLVYDVAAGHYYLWFRTIHVLQVAASILLAVRLMQPRTALDAALVPGALAILVGLHTFPPTIREAFPINSFVTVIACCLAVANISLERAPRWWTDALACALLVGTTLTVESGLLVWVVCAAAWIAGARGLSSRALALMTLLVAAYVLYRFGIAGTVGGPALNERASGFGFRVLEPPELVARFGAHPAVFYAYNIVASFLTVLLSEPKAGVYWFTYEATIGQFDAWTVVSVATSAGTTAIIAWYLWTRRAALLARATDRDDRIVLLFGAVLAANAVLSFPYTKNVIMSAAGVFLAPAAFVAMRRLLAAARRRTWLAIACVLLLNAGWTFRAIGTHVNLRATALQQRNEWAHVDEWLVLQRLTLDGADAVGLRDTLQRDAVFVHPTPPQPTGRWTEWFRVD